MAVTTQNSTQVEKVDSTAIQKMLATHESHGRLRLALFDFTQVGVGDAGSIARVVKLPAGKCRVFLPLSRIAFSAMGAARTMDVGFEAHTQEDGTAVVADPNGLDDGVDAAAAGSVVPGGTVGGDETFLFDSKEGVVLTLQINDGTIPAAATLKGYFVYVVD